MVPVVPYDSNSLQENQSLHQMKQYKKMAEFKRRPRKKKTILKSLKEIFRNGTNSAKRSPSSSSCTWTVIDSFGEVSLDDQDYDEDGYGNYDEFEGYSSSDFFEDESSSSSSSHKNIHRNKGFEERVPSLSEDSVASCRSADGDEEIVGQKKVTIITSTERWGSQDARPLIARGKVYYRHKLYQDALSLYIQASELIQSIISDHNCTDARLLLQDAIVKYEISKSKHALLKESSITLGEHSKEREIAHNKVRHGKLNVLNKTVVYYRDELLRLNGGCNKIDVLNLEKVGYILHLLHTLGDIHGNKLAQYSHALSYYTKALELEIEVFSLIEVQDESVSSMNDDALELRKRSITIQATRNKIGKVQYLTGRLDLAMKSTFLPNMASSR